MDDFFVSGVNHVFSHGTCYSPDEAPWPGWLFYAATEMNPRNAFCARRAALNTYIARCLAILQAGNPDSDVLLYWPIADLWHDPKRLVQNLTVHSPSLPQQPVARSAGALGRGFLFDYASDRQILRCKPGTGNHVPGGTYRVWSFLHKKPALRDANCSYRAGRSGAGRDLRGLFARPLPGLRHMKARSRTCIAVCTHSTWSPRRGPACIRPWLAEAVCSSGSLQPAPGVAGISGRPWSIIPA